MARNLEIAKLFYTLEANSKGLEAELGRAEKSLGRTAAFIKANPVLALGALGTAFAGVAAKATAMASDFEKSMAEVSTLVDTASVDMTKLGEGVLALYRGLPVENIDQLTNGLYNVISAGVPAGEAIDYLGVAAKAAVGGVTDVNTAVNGLTTATNAFATQGLTAQEAADKFFTAVRLGKTTFAEISGSIGNVAGLANSLGVSLDDLLSNMTALTLGGLNTSTAFNSLRQILANVAKPTKELTDSYPELAKQFDLAALKSKGLTAFMTELAAKLKGNDDAAVKMFGSVEALNAVLSLTADGGARLNGIQEAMANSAGASAAAFDKMAATNKALNQILKNEFAAAMIDLGQKLLPIVNTALRAAIGLIETFTGKIAAIRSDAAVNSIDTISKAFDRLSPESRARELDRLRGAIQQVLAPGTSPVNSFDALIGGGTRLGETIDKLTSGQLQSLYKGLSTAANSGALTAREMDSVTVALRGIASTLTGRGDQIIPTEATASITDAGAAATDTSTALVRMGESAEDAAKKAKEAAEKYAQGMRRIQDILVASTATLVDDTTLAIAKLRQELAESGVSAEDAARALRPLNEQLALIKVNEKFDLPEILAKSATAFTDRDVSRLISAQQALDALYKSAAAGSNEQLAIGRQRDAVQQALLSRVTATTAQVNAAVAPSQKLRDLAAQYGVEIDASGRKIPVATEAVKDLGAEVARVAQGAIGVAQGFGLINSEAAAVLQNVVTIGENLGKALGGDATSIFAVLGGLAGVIGGLFSGNSAEERARKELIAKNTQALADLVRVNGNLLRVSSPGFRLAGARDALAGIDPSRFGALDRGSSLDRAKATRDIGQLLTQALAAQGLTLGDLTAVGKDLGIDIKDSEGRLSGAGLQQLLEALRTGQFTRFADEIEEQFERIRGMIEVGLIDPADELAEVVRVLSRPEVGKGVPAIAQAFRDLDLSTAGGKAEGIKRVQALFDSLNTGALEVGQLGGLSGADFRDVLLRLFGLLGGKPIEAATPDATDPEAPGITGGGGGVGAAGGSLVGGASATFDDLFGVSVAARDFLASIDAQLKSPKISPIALPAGYGSGTVTAPGAGSTVTFGDFHVTVQVANTAATADDIARASAEAVDKLLYARLAELRLAQGDGRLL